MIKESNFQRINFKSYKSQNHIITSLQVIVLWINSFLFILVAGDKVVIRDWSTCNQDKPTLSKKRKYKADKMHFFKTSLCWFNAHHPDGCPRLASDCQFAHGEGELKKLSLPSR